MFPQSASRIEGGSGLRRALVNMFHFGSIIFIVLFALAIYLETDISSLQNSTYQVVKEKIANKSPIIISDIPTTIETNIHRLDTLRYFLIIFSFFMIPLTVYTNYKYDLDEL